MPDGSFRLAREVLVRLATPAAGEPDGAQDTGGYNTEQILSTTHSRIYRSLGGDPAYVDTRRFAARTTAHLLLGRSGP